MTRGKKIVISQTHKDLVAEATQRERERKKAGKRTRPVNRVDSAPKHRSECIDGPRPCPYVACRYHLFLSIQTRGNIVFPYGDDPEAILGMEHTCALDVANRGVTMQQDVADMFQVSRQRIDQEEIVAMKKLRECAEKPDV